MRGVLPERAGVVVIGGGVIGTGVALHLAEAGVPDVLLLERDALASGSMSKAAGGVRAQFSDGAVLRQVTIGLGTRPVPASSRGGTFRRIDRSRLEIHHV